MFTATVMLIRSSIQDYTTDLKRVTSRPGPHREETNHARPLPTNTTLNAQIHAPIHPEVNTVASPPPPPPPASARSPSHYPAHQASQTTHHPKTHASVRTALLWPRRRVIERCWQAVEG